MQISFTLTLVSTAITEMLPNILSQLGPENLDNLRWLASTLSKSTEDGKPVPAAPIAEEDEEMPGLRTVAISV